MPKKKTSTKSKTTKKSSSKSRKSSSAAKKTVSKTSSVSKTKAVASQTKSKPKTEVSPEMSLTQLVLMFVVFMVVNSVVVLVANTLFPENVVLGTHLISPLQALIQSMAVFSLITVAAAPVIEAIADQMKVKLGFGHWMLLYAVINTIALWVTARFAELVGLGISSWVVVVVLAVVLDFAQGAAMALTQDNS